MPVGGWLAALLVGLFAGAVSGLVGIGGGAIMVPFLYFFLARSGLSGTAVPLETQAVVAHATSLLVIVPTSVRGAWLYHREGLVEWDAVWRMGVASVIAAVLGARVAVAVPGPLLKLAFGLFLLVIAARLAGRRRGPAEDDDAAAPGAIRRGPALAGGAAVGFFSALLGVGGGLVAIPVLIYALRVSMRRVSGTSLALITFTALTGAIAYAVSGWYDAGAAAGLLGYFQLPAALALAVGAFLAVPVGTNLQLRLPTHALRLVIAIVFVLLGARIAIGNLLHLLPL